LIFGGIQAQLRNDDKPTLIVGVVVDGLQAQHLELMWSRLSDIGLRRIVNQGSEFKQVQYNIMAGGMAADAATLVSGSVPLFHGVVGDNFYNKKSKKIESILADETQVGIGTTDKFSPKNLLASTFTDELRMANPASRVFAVAVEPEAAIMLGGHNATGAAWIDDKEIRWATTGYYNNGLMPSADAMNTGSNFTNQLVLYWKPLYPIATYLNKPILEGLTERFRYDMRLQTSGNKTRPLIKNTPSANTLVNELAMKLLQNEKLGKQSVPDVLLLQYTVRPPNENTTALGSAEKEDMYFRLDKDLSFLLSEIEKSAGISNTLLFITANQTGTHSPDELKAQQIPAGTFSPKRAMSLLSIYLMALYGHEPWIADYYGKNIYLNREKIEEKKLNLRDFQQVVADFMLEFEGVQSAYTAAQVMSMGGGETNGEMSRIRNSFTKTSAGDVVVTLQPGWVETNEKGEAIGVSNSAISSVPLYVFGWKTPKQTVEQKYWITDIAPTLCKILNIPTPNANVGTVISELVKEK
jgi:hypothetical protein